MLPEGWNCDRNDGSVLLLRLEPPAPAGALVDLRDALDLSPSRFAAPILVFDIRGHDSRLAGTRQAMAELADAATNLGRTSIFISEDIRGAARLPVVRTEQELDAWLSREGVDRREN